MHRPGLRHPAIEGAAIAAVLALVATATPHALGLFSGPLGDLPLSPVLVAILLGVGLARPAHSHPEWTPGLRLASGPLLNVAIMLVGLRLSLGELGVLGLAALPLAVGALVSGLSLAWLLGRALGVGTRLTALIAVGSAICGASAVAATAPALRCRPEETAYALACVTLIGLVATLAYPWLLGAWLPDPQQVGLVLGAAIHDTAQVTAAALVFEQSFGDPAVVSAATVTKLMRNVSMLVLIPGVVWWALRGEWRDGARPPFPHFILGFLAFAAARSVGDLLFPEQAAWRALLDAASVLSAFLFAMAMGAIGMGIRAASLRGLGIRPMLVAVYTATGMVAVALLIISLGT
jgi:uncharacterized integral membrane protein (TIGR00698 family)